MRRADLLSKEWKAAIAAIAFAVGAPHSYTLTLKSNINNLHNLDPALFFMFRGSKAHSASRIILPFLDTYDADKEECLDFFSVPLQAYQFKTCHERHSVTRFRPKTGTKRNLSTD